MRTIKDNPLISVIVPVYNTEKTLKRCLDSILDQTYKNLEILVIDDGSPDNSGRIIDEYSLIDDRIKVFHKENGGLSSARNLGLDFAKGDYIGFVDSDDWIEPNTYEIMLRGCLNHNTDISIVGRFIDRPGKSKVFKLCEEPEIIDSETAIYKPIVENSIDNVVWNKLYRKELFENIRFPEGYNYEDMRTTYKLIQKAKLISLLPDICYHYVMCTGSIAHTSSVKNLIDHWIASNELYSVFSTKSEDYRKACVSGKIISIFKMWSWLPLIPDIELKKYENIINDIIKDMTKFSKDHLREVLFSKSYGIKEKVGCFLGSHNNKISYFIAYLINQTRRKILGFDRVYKLD